MKWLKDESYNALKAAAGHWGNVVESVIKSNPEMKAEDITADMVSEAMEHESDDSDVKNQLQTALNELTQKAKEIERLQSDIAQLKATPAIVKPEAKIENEPTAGPENLIDFAVKHEDDSLAIMQKAKEQGFF